MDRSARGRGNFDAEDYGAIKVGGRPGPEAEEARRIFALTVFVRVVALLWIVQGLELWLRIIAPAHGSFDELSAGDHDRDHFLRRAQPGRRRGAVAARALGRGGLASDPDRAIFRGRCVKPSFFLFGGALKFVDAVLFGLYLFLSWRADSLSGEPSAFDDLIARLRALARRGRHARCEQIST